MPKRKVLIPDETDEIRNSQRYQLNKADILQYVKENQIVTVGEIAKEFKQPRHLMSILSDLEIEKQIERKVGPPEKIRYIGNIKQPSKEFLGNNQNKQNYRDVNRNISITHSKYSKATPFYKPYGKNKTF